MRITRILTGRQPWSPRVVVEAWAGTWSGVVARFDALLAFLADEGGPRLPLAWTIEGVEISRSAGLPHTFGKLFLAGGFPRTGQTSSPKLDPVLAAIPEKNRPKYLEPTTFFRDLESCLPGGGTLSRIALFVGFGEGPTPESLKLIVEVTAAAGDRDASRTQLEELVGRIGRLEILASLASEGGIKIEDSCWQAQVPAGGGKSQGKAFFRIGAAFPWPGG